MPVAKHKFLTQTGPDVGPIVSRREWLCQTGALATMGLQMPLARAATPTASSPANGNEAIILCYHRFADTVADSMTVRKSTFLDHIAAIQQAGAHVIPLADLVAHHQGKLASLPPKPVVITIDDGHRSVYEVMAPMVEKLNWPMTLFIYPSAISNASYAMRWEQIKHLQDTGHFNVQSHTYWHPNLVRERKQQSPADFQRFAMNQLERSRKVLQDRMGQPVSYLAWPFGMLDDGLMSMAAAAGYQTSLALGNKPCVKSDPIQALPRYLMVDEFSGKHMSQILHAAWPSGVTS
jgi:peptidoglycan/xylan/chitin deacetylase (PgdA/CDA1 family)